MDANIRTTDCNIFGPFLYFILHSHLVYYFPIRLQS